MCRHQKRVCLYSMNSFPRSAMHDRCAFELYQLARLIPRERRAQPAPPRMVTFSESLRTLANNAIPLSSEGTERLFCCSRNFHSRLSCLRPRSRLTSPRYELTTANAALRNRSLHRNPPAPRGICSDEKTSWQYITALGRIDVSGGWFPENIRLPTSTYSESGRR